MRVHIMLDVFGCAIHAWSDINPGDAHDARCVVDRLGRLADQSTNITLFHVDVDDPYDIRRDIHRHNVDLRAEWTRLGEYPDTSYISSLVPAFLDARDGTAPAIDTVQTQIQDVFAVYDRLLLPCGGTKRRAEFLLSFTRTRLVLPLAPKFQPLSGEDSTVLSLLAQGHTRTSIAARLRLSVGTINAVIDRLSEGFGASTETQLVAMAVAQELARSS